MAATAESTAGSTEARSAATVDLVRRHAHRAWPWHLVGIMGEPRRMAYYDFNDPGLAQKAIWVSVSTIGGFILVFSALLLVIILLASHRRAVAIIPPLTFALALRPLRKLPVY